MCCYKEFKNFERFNNLVQLIVHRAIRLIETLPRDCKRRGSEDGGSGVPEDQTKDSADDKKSDDLDSEKELDVTGIEVDQKEDIKQAGDAVIGEVETGVTTTADLKGDSDAKSKGGGEGKENKPVDADRLWNPEEQGEEEEMWTLEEKDRLFNFVSKVFLMNFPLYMAYKHCVHASLEELSKQDTNALNNYCELTVSYRSLIISL